MWLTPCVRPISWASSSDAPFSGPFLKGQAAAGMKSTAAFVSSGFCTGHPCRELATFRMASSLGHVAGPPLCSGKSTCTVDQHQGLLNGQTLEDACAEDARVCILHRWCLWHGPEGWECAGSALHPLAGSTSRHLLRL